MLLWAFLFAFLIFASGRWLSCPVYRVQRIQAQSPDIVGQ